MVIRVADVHRVAGRRMAGTRSAPKSPHRERLSGTERVGSGV